MFRAFYKFRFYELDQSLRVGSKSNCVFFLDPHFDAVDDSIISEGMNLVFYNSLGDHRKVSALCGVVRIWHPEFGDIEEIDTVGLDYRVVLSDQTVIEINAEEDPGKCTDPAYQPRDWSFIVDLEFKTAQQGGSFDPLTRPAGL